MKVKKAVSGGGPIRARAEGAARGAGGGAGGGRSHHRHSCLGIKRHTYALNTAR